MKLACKLLALPLACLAMPSMAVNYKINGFMSLVAGETVSGNVSETDYYGFKCPCFIADYNNGALYEKGDLAVDHESRAGIQMNLSLTDTFSLITQAVARASTSSAKIEWAYLSWDFEPGWTFQAGRKRIPLYFYSEFQDVGLSYSWARPPQPLYGWEASNYNGGSIRYSSNLGSWDFTSSIYAGQEEVKKSGYSRIYSSDFQDVRWDNIVGGDIEVTHDWFTGRFIIMSSKNSSTSRPDSNEFSTPATEQSIIGLALNGDFEKWFVLSEFNVNKRKNDATGYDISGPAMMLAVGERLGAFTLFASSSRYWEKTGNIDMGIPERFIDNSLTLRYDINSSNAIKFQFDQLRNKSQFDFVGDANVVTLSYDMVF